MMFASWIVPAVSTSGLLRRSDMTVGAVADLVGYSTPFALSNAFKRVRGISPKQHRELVVA